MKGRIAFGVGVLAWAASMCGAVVLPALDARGYATVWTAAVAAVASVFVVGYAVRSRPSRDEHGKRRWVGEWFWLPSLPAVIMLVYANSFVFRLILPAPTNPTAEQTLAQRFSAGIAVTVFFLLLWLTVMWARRQVGVRRAGRTVR